MSASDSRRTIRVDALARVEGEGALLVRLRDGRVTDVQLRIYEPPRFFEALLRGRLYSEAPDITARICGICPVAYQMSAVHALEAALGVVVDAPTRALRRLLYCGEWIESHVLHVAMLHAPDFLGYESALHMVPEHRDLVELALAMKKTGNDLVALVGGREIHPINVRVGGFYKVPEKRALRALVERLERAREGARRLVALVGGFSFPEFEADYEFVALRHPDEYPMNQGRLTSSRGLDAAVSDYEEHFVEEHAPHSNALQSILRRRGAYHVGPLARYSLNFDRLSEGARDAARSAGLGPVCRNPFRSIVVRSVETLFAIEEALRLIGEYEPPDHPQARVEVHAGTGHGCTEAPRGLLYHRYQLDANGLILAAKIVPPTAQNQRSIEDDLRQLVPQSLDLPDDKLQWRCEQAIRNYDPCISCATHFLKLTLERT